MDNAHIPKGEPIPQTVESLQEVMAKDAVLMQKQGKEIWRLKCANLSLRKRLLKCRQKHTDHKGDADGQAVQE